jgi:hypothetical protein
MGWLGGLGQLQQTPGRIKMEKMIYGSRLTLDFGKTLKNSTMRFRRNLDIGFFSKFF